MEKSHQYLNIKDGVYKTSNPKKKLHWLLATSIFNLKMAVIVLKASSKAKRGKFTNDEWCKSSLSIVKALEYVGAEFEVEGFNNIE
ncbi:MAG: hypothetical protein N3A61_05800, partial [Ignavibacteria bacterium]|nr:hypothetical protein [Ignavibacteria bacterium]